MADQPPVEERSILSVEGHFCKDADNPSIPTTSTGHLPLLKHRLEQYPSSSKRSHPDVFCAHCDHYVCEKTYKKHCSLFRNDDNSSIEESWMNEEWRGKQHELCVPDFPVDISSSLCAVPRPINESNDCTDVVGTDDPESEPEDLPGAPVTDDIEEIWENSDDHDASEMLQLLDLPVPSMEDLDASSSSNSAIRSLVTWLTGFILLLQAVHSTSDAVISAIIKFFKIFFTVMGQFSDFMARFAAAVPSSLYTLRKCTNEKTTFTKFVICPSCHKVYRFDECIITSGGCKVSSRCSFVRYPRHPHLNRRAPCGSLLLKSVKLSSGAKVLAPIKSYPYKPIFSSLQQFLMRPGFVDLCRQWESRVTLPGVKFDVYDGKIWESFQVVDGKPFLSCKDSLGLGLMLNVDWFQPYKHLTYSVGAIYLTIMNLSRAVRFKRNNVILVGILPGPSEPKHDINLYLQPLVEELNDFWTGVKLCTNASGSSPSYAVVRCALLCVACDLPAGRKLCGFLSHAAKLGCSKCFKSFPGTVGSMDYSGFQRSSWLPRNNTEHRDRVHRVSQAKTKVEQTTLESSFGCRYSVLLQLPYFDAPRMLVIDPMHNLFLGTGKHMLHFWLDHETIHRSQYSQIQASVDSMVVPSDVGRIPHKIISGFSSFTADQFKNWILYFSIPVLYGILPHEQLECWRGFVLACRILCKRQLSLYDIALSDALLLRFCQRSEDLYGNAFITPNMHMHGHIKEAVEDYGPVFGFWLFSFERYNGILGNQTTNSRDIECQLLKRFLGDNAVFSFDFPSEFSSDFKDVCCTDQFLVGSLKDSSLAVHIPSQAEAVVPDVATRGVLEHDDAAYLLELYHRLYSTESGSVTVNSIYMQYTSICLRGRNFGSSKSRHVSGSRPFIAMAEWDQEVFGSQPTLTADEVLDPYAKSRPVKIAHFIKVSFNVATETSTFTHDHLVAAVVEWFKPHPSKNKIGKPAQVWNHNQYENGGLSSFVPVHFLKSRCAHCVIKLENQSVLVVVPLVE